MIDIPCSLVTEKNCEKSPSADKLFSAAGVDDNVLIQTSGFGKPDVDLIGSLRGVKNSEH